MKRIVFIDYAATFGGSIISLYTLIKYIDKTKFYPIVVTCKQNKNDYFVQKGAPEGSSLVKMNIYQPWVNNKIFKFVDKFSHKLATAGRYVFWTKLVTLYDIMRFYLLGKRLKADAFHINNGFGYSLAPLIAASLLGIPCVGHFRDVDYPYGGLVEQAKKYIKYYIAVSNDTRARVIEKFSLPPDKIETIWNAVDDMEYHHLDTKHLKGEFGLTDETVVSILGRVIEWKGVKEFVRAAKIVADSYPNVKFFIVGSGDEHYIREVKELTKELGIEDKVIFTGYRKDFALFITLSKVIVNASTRPEPFGRTINEAMCLATPVVANAAGGSIEQVVNGKTGFLVPTGDYEAMGNAILKIITDEPLCRQMCLAARERFNNNFRAQKHSRKVEKLYEQKIFN